MPKKIDTKKIVKGYVVAFNDLPDAIWFDVVDRVGQTIEIREHDTTYATQKIDVCYVKHIR